MSQKILTTIILLILVLAFPVKAQETGTPRVVTLNECLELADVSNIGLQRTRLGIQISLLQRIRAESVFDPGFDLSFSTRRADSSTSTGTSSNLDLGLNYRLPNEHGGTWVMSLDQTRSWGSTTLGGESTNFTKFDTQLGVAYSHELMESRSSFINRLGIIRSDLAINRSHIAVTDAARTLRVRIIEAYIQSVLASRRIDVAQLSLGTAEQLVEEVQARIDVGQLAPYELLSAQSGLAEREEAVINAGSAFQVSLDNLKGLVGLPITDEILVDQGFLKPVYFECSPDELLTIAQRNRPDLEELDLRIQQAELDILLAEDRIMPSLTWNTVVGVSGQGESYGDSIGDLNNFNFFTGLEYSLPLGGNRAAVSDRDTTLLTIEQLQLEKTDFLRTLELDIRTACENLQNALLRIDVTAQGLEVQELKLEREQLRFDLGLSTSRDLLEIDLELANARLAHDTAMADALTALGRLEYLANQPLLDSALQISNILADPDGGGDG